MLDIIFNCDHRCDALIPVKLKEIDKGSTSGDPGCLRYLIALESVYTASARKEHNIVMSIGHHQFDDDILIKLCHALDTTAAAVLAAEVIHGHALDITHLSQGNNRIFALDQVLVKDLLIIDTNAGSSVIAVFITDHRDFIPDDTEKYLFIGQDSLEFADPFHQLVIFILQLFSFQTGQRTQTHINNGLGLRFRQAKGFHQPGLGNSHTFR